MSDLIWTAKTGEVSLSAATAKTVLQIVAPSNHRLKVLRWGVFFDGTTVGNEPVLVEIVRQSTAGTMSALTLVKNDDSIAETIQSTAQHTATAEPTSGDVIDIAKVHPQSPWVVLFPLGQELKVGGGDRLGIRCTAADAVQVVGMFVVEE